MYFNENPPGTTSTNNNGDENSSWKRSIKTEESSPIRPDGSFSTHVPIKVKEEAIVPAQPVAIPPGPGSSVPVTEWNCGAPPLPVQGQTFAQAPLGWNPYPLPYNHIWPQHLPVQPTVDAPYSVPPPAFPDNSNSISNTTTTSQQNSNTRSFVPDPNNSKEIYEWVHSLNKNKNSSVNSRERGGHKSSHNNSSSSSRYRGSSPKLPERKRSPGRGSRKDRYENDKYSKDRGSRSSPSRRKRSNSRNGRHHREEIRSSRDGYRSGHGRDRERESEMRRDNRRPRSRESSPLVKKDNRRPRSREASPQGKNDNRRPRSREASPQGKKDNRRPRSRESSPQTKDKDKIVIPSGKNMPSLSSTTGRYGDRSRRRSSDRFGRRESQDAPQKVPPRFVPSSKVPVREEIDFRSKEPQKDRLSNPSRVNPNNKRERKRRSNSRQRPTPAKRDRPDVEREIIKSDIDFETDIIKEEPDQDVLEDIGEVEKWIRSAPDDLYYERLFDGEVKAKERTKLLCDKFFETLIFQAENSRLEAEKQGSEKMEELYTRETQEIAALKECQDKTRKKCRSSKKENNNKVPNPKASEISKDTCKSDGKDKPKCSDLSNNTGAGENSISTQLSSEIPVEIPSLPSENVSLPPISKSEKSTTVVEKDVSKDTGAVSELEEGEVEGSDDEVGVNQNNSNQVVGEAISSDEEFLNKESKKDAEEAKKDTGKSNTAKDKRDCCHPVKDKAKCKEKTCPKSKSGCKGQKESTSNQCKSKCNQSKKKKKASAKSKMASSSSTSDSESGSKDSDSDLSDEDPMSRSDTANRELERRKKHPRRLHVELWHNDPGLMNDGPVCRCSAKARRCGIRHGFYPGETKIPLCEPFSNNAKVLRHYRITISPPKNFLVNTPTVIDHDGHEYIFEGFSLFSHYPIDINLPPCRVIRFNIRYDIFVEDEKFPDSFCVKELMHFEKYIFREILELVDLKYDCNEDEGCPQFHLMPRFVRQLPDNGKEILSMSRVLMHLLKKNKELVKEEDLHTLYTVEQTDWQNFADRHKGMIVTKWGMKPSSIRVDQIDRDVSGQEQEDDGIPFPLIVHFGIRPPQLSYAGNAGYQRAWRRYVKYRHLLSNMPKPTAEDKRKLLVKELKLQEMRTASTMKRDVTVAISSKGFRTTGVCCDLVQHAMLIPVLVAHLRFHKGLAKLESTMSYKFKNRYLLQLAMTHPSYRENFGTNPDHARNALTNCGIRQPEYGDRRIHYASTRKRGINTLINIMARFGAEEETESEITHNERLEFLGDAVVEFVTSIHLYHIFPDLEEGGLATYRAAIVQNQHLAVLAQTLDLDQFMLYAHGSDLCHDSELRHAMANCFEALMGALFLDGANEVWSQIDIADRVFGQTLFGDDSSLWHVWTYYPKHPLQSQEPLGDRQWVNSHSVLQNLVEFEESIGVEFTHIRLLARAFTDRSLGYNNLSQGSNQRLEFLGDTVLQLISSEYLYRHFPDHHEGHLSLLRSSLVNNRTQSLVCDDLGMTKYAMRGDPKSDMKTKDRADLLEAFLGALYIDKGLKHCVVFCSVCFFPRLNKSIIKQEWNDPKSKLQQCCLTLRAMDGREPDIPVYKVTESLGPTNTRIYIVAVYFRGKRLATAQGHSIQEAEMNAAALALEVSGHLFPQLHHQKRIIDKTNKNIN